MTKLEDADERVLFYGSWRRQKKKRGRLKMDCLRKTDYKKGQAQYRYLDEYVACHFWNRSDRMSNIPVGCRAKMGYLVQPNPHKIRSSLKTAGFRISKLHIFPAMFCNISLIVGNLNLSEYAEVLSPVLVACVPGCRASRPRSASPRRSTPSHSATWRRYPSPSTPGGSTPSRGTTRTA